jgi:hypothetical protein
MARRIRIAARPDWADTIVKQVLVFCPSSLLKKSAMWGGRPRPTPSSASVSREVAQPDQGSGAGEGARPTSITNHWDGRLA